MNKWKRISIIMSFENAGKKQMAIYISAWTISVLMELIFEGITGIVIDAFTTCIISFSGAYVAWTYIREKKTAMRMLPISRGEIVLSGIYFSILVAVIAIVLAMLIAFFISLIVGEEPGVAAREVTMLEQVMVWVLGIRLWGIYMIAFGFKEVVHNIVSLVIGFVAIVVVALVEWFCLAPVLSEVATVVVAFLVAIIFAAAGCIVSYYRLKPKKYME